MITNYAGIKKSQEDAKETEKKYKDMLEYGLDKEESAKKPQTNFLGLFALIIVVILFTAFAFFEFVNLFFLH